MARFVFALSAIALTIFLAPLIYASSQEDQFGNVFFLESNDQAYMRRSYEDGNAEEDVFSAEDTAAAIAVLLGVPPPVLLSPSSSGKLDSLLSSNPFKRPHAVVSLTMRGVLLDSLSSQEIEDIFGSSSFQQRPFSVNAHQKPFEFSGRDVTLQLLNNGENGLEQLQLEQGLQAVVSFLKGSYHKEEETDVTMLKIPLPFGDDISITLDLHKSSDRKFAVELVSLFQSTQSVQKGLQQGAQNIAKLFMGTFTALESMDEESAHSQAATKLFLYAAVRVVGTLEATCDGQIVGVFVMPSTTTMMTRLPLFSIVTESRSARFLLDNELAPSPSASYSNKTVLEAADKLVGRSIILVTVIVLLIATGLGSFFLVYMPLTRDALLYSGAKLD